MHLRMESDSFNLFCYSIFFYDFYHIDLHTEFDIHLTIIHTATARRMANGSQYKYSM